MTSYIFEPSLSVSELATRYKESSADFATHHIEKYKKDFSYAVRIYQERGYYTLEEASKKVNSSLEEISNKAANGEIIVLGFTDALFVPHWSITNGEINAIWVDAAKLFGKSSQPTRFESWCRETLYVGYPIDREYLTEQTSQSILSNSGKFNCVAVRRVQPIDLILQKGHHDVDVFLEALKSEHGGLHRDSPSNLYIQEMAKKYSSGDCSLPFEINSDYDVVSPLKRNIS